MTTTHQTNDNNKLYGYAIHYLSRYPKTRKEMEKQLLAKGFTFSDIQHTLDILAEQHVIDDRKFAESYVYSECVKKGKPIIAIKHKLLYKGIDKEILDEILHHHTQGIQDGITQKIIKDITLYKNRGIQGLQIIQKLMQKGYTSDQIKDAVARRDRQ